MVKADDAAVVESVLEVDWHSYVAQNVPCQVMVGQYLDERLPAVLYGILLEEVVFAPIATDLELGAESIGSA